MVKSGSFACNVVADDLVWKDHVAKELRTAKQWPEHWSFLTSDQAENHQENHHHHNRNYTSEKSESKKERLKLPPINHVNNKKEKRSKPFPQTTTDFIGWKSSVPENNLDIYGPYTKPIRTFLSQMKWPPEAVI